jgi:hypothetical protein
MKKVGKIKAQAQEEEYKKLNWLLKVIGIGQQDCTGTYTECFYSNSLLSLEENQQVDIDQFNELVQAIYFDISEHDPKKWNLWQSKIVRRVYDTPFWNVQYNYKDPNNPDLTIRVFRTDTVVCFGSECDVRSDINYFAQGMWGAALGESLEKSIGIAQDYKAGEYQGEELSDAARYWIKYGYEAYQKLEVNETPNSPYQ